MDLPQRHRGHGVSVNRKTGRLPTDSSALIYLACFGDGNPPANEMGSFVFGTKPTTNMTLFNFMFWSKVLIISHLEWEVIFLARLML